jgi:hypothetical protein
MLKCFYTVFGIAEHSELDAFCVFKKSDTGLLLIDVYRKLDVRGKSMLAIILFGVAAKLKNTIMISEETSNTAKQLLIKLVAYSRMHTNSKLNAEQLELLDMQYLYKETFVSSIRAQPRFREDYILQPMTYLRYMEHEEYD